uniref:Uncharacterized protein n=1 Tax=Arundo donax TaxID=35708 RepID=A0A0A8ZKL7_ARUDO
MMKILVIPLPLLVKTDILVGLEPVSSGCSFLCKRSVQ